jgi:hypothetical protein
MASTTTQPNSRHSQRSQHSRPAGRARVTLGRNACGVLLKLEERRPNGSRIMVITAFTQASSLEEWCMNDPLRLKRLSCINTFGAMLMRFGETTRGAVRQYRRQPILFGADLNFDHAKPRTFPGLTAPGDAHVRRQDFFRSAHGIRSVDELRAHRATPQRQLRCAQLPCTTSLAKTGAWPMLRACHAVPLRRSSNCSWASPRAWLQGQRAS